jgi:hypothetical protein
LTGWFVCMGLIHTYVVLIMTVALVGDRNVHKCHLLTVVLQRQYYIYVGTSLVPQSREAFSAPGNGYPRAGLVPMYIQNRSLETLQRFRLSNQLCGVGLPQAPQAG